MARGQELSVYGQNLTGPCGLAVQLIVQAVRDSRDGDLSAWLWIKSGADGWLGLLGGALDVDTDKLRMEAEMALNCKDYGRWRSKLTPADREQLDSFIALVSNVADGGALSADDLAQVGAVADELDALSRSEAETMPALSKTLAVWARVLRDLLRGMEEAPVTNRAPPVLLAHSERRPYDRRAPPVLLKERGGG